MLAVQLCSDAALLCSSPVLPRCVASRGVFLANLAPASPTLIRLTPRAVTARARARRLCTANPPRARGAANVILFLFYLSPLSTLLDVLRHRDSTSLVLPLCAMNVGNGTLWLVYGLVRGDPFIWVPNGVGALLGVLQTALCLIFPRRQPPVLPQCASVLLGREHGYATVLQASSVLDVGAPARFKSTVAGAGRVCVLQRAPCVCCAHAHTCRHWP